MAVHESDLALDRAIAEISGQIPFLRLVTPTNASEARKRFLDGADPEFTYLEPPDLSELQERLGQISPETASDKVIASLAERLIREIGLRLEMVRARNTDRFLLLAVELFGHVAPETLDAAETILAGTDFESTTEPTVGADEFAAAASAELDIYREAHPEIRARVEVSSSTSGVMVESGNLFVGSTTRIAKSRVSQLVQHEVGTHIVTYENGLAQPLHMLSTGLAGYDELQEALGVLAEYLSGGLSPRRLRVLAYRVVAAHMRSDGASFRTCYEWLLETGCHAGTAFTTVMRAYRSGGMTKDALYLRGLIRLLDHLASGNDLESLYVGKIGFDSIPLVAELTERGVIQPPSLRPRFLETEAAKEKIDRLRQGLRVHELKESAA